VMTPCVICRTPGVLKKHARWQVASSARSDVRIEKIVVNCVVFVIVIGLVIVVKVEIVLYNTCSGTLNSM
jgi:hypothetical protein